MKCVLLDLCPSASLGLIFPDENFAIIRTGCEDVSKFWMSPRDLPNGSRMASKMSVVVI